MAAIYGAKHPGFANAERHDKRAPTETPTVSGPFGHHCHQAVRALRK